MPLFYVLKEPSAKYRHNTDKSSRCRLSFFVLDFIPNINPLLVPFFSDATYVQRSLHIVEISTSDFPCEMIANEDKQQMGHLTSV